MVLPGGTPEKKDQVPASLPNLHETTPGLQQSKGTTNVIIMTLKESTGPQASGWLSLDAAGIFVVDFLLEKKHHGSVMKYEMICKLHILNGILEQTSVGKVQQKYFQFGRFARGDL